MEEEVQEPHTPNPVLKKPMSSEITQNKSHKVGSDINNKSLEIRSLRSAIQQNLNT